MENKTLFQIQNFLNELRERLKLQSIAIESNPFNNEIRLNINWGSTIIFISEWEHFMDTVDEAVARISTEMAVVIPPTTTRYGQSQM